MMMSSGQLTEAVVVVGPCSWLQFTDLYIGGDDGYDDDDDDEDDVLW